MPKTGFSGIFPAFSGSVTFWALSFCIIVKKSEKTNEPILRKAGNRRTDGRTNGRTKVNLKDLRGRSKNGK